MRACLTVGVDYKKDKLFSEEHRAEEKENFRLFVLFLYFHRKSTTQKKKTKRSGVSGSSEMCSFVPITEIVQKRPIKLCLSVFFLRGDVRSPFPRPPHGIRRLMDHNNVALGNNDYYYVITGLIVHLSCINRSPQVDSDGRRRTSEGARKIRKLMCSACSCFAFLPGQRTITEFDLLIQVETDEN